MKLRLPTIALGIAMLGATVFAGPAQAATSANYPDPGKAFSTVKVKVGDHTDLLWLKQISKRTLVLEGKDTRWMARYDVQVRNGDGAVLLDRNLSVYKVNWIYVHFNTTKRYASDADMLSAFAAATQNGSETNARSEFKSIYGSLGKFRTPNGKLQAPLTKANYNPEAFSNLAVNVGRGEDRVWIKPISTRTLMLNGNTAEGTNRGAAGDYNKARYDVQIRSADSTVVFDENLTVYRLDYFLRHFSLTKSYASNADLFATLTKANGIKEQAARDLFEKRYGTLGQFKTTGGTLQDPQKVVSL